MDMDADSGWRRQEILYPAMLIAAISVIVFSMVGIAAMTGLIPSTVSGYRMDRDAPRPAPQREATRAPQAAAAQSRKPAADACADCGVVESIRSLQRQGEGAAVGGVPGKQAGVTVPDGNVAGAGAGMYAGKDDERAVNARVTYQVRLKMGDGSHRNVYQALEPRVAVGQRVRVSDGQLRTEQ